MRTSNALSRNVSRLLDSALDRSVILGYSKLAGPIRRGLPTWPDDVPPGALAGRHIAVTGATSGLGRETAAGLAQLGAHAHLVVRDVAKGEQVAASLREAGACEVSIWRCDVGDLDSVRAFAASFAAAFADTGTALHGIVHNAGALPAQRQESPQGHELTMAVHVLGPVLMTQLLLPVLADHEGRVVFVTSGGMYAQRLRADDPEFQDGEYAGTAAYARSKRAQVELVGVLARRWAAADVAVYATHPGWTDTPGVTESIPGFAKVTKPILRGTRDGADTTIWLMGVEPRPAAGGLWHDRRERPTHYVPWTRTGAADRDELWAWVSDATGIS